MAPRFWPREDPLGKRFNMNGDAGPLDEVVGVTGDGKYVTLGEDPQPCFFVPLDPGAPSRSARCKFARTPHPNARRARGRTVAGLAPDLSIINIETMKQFLEGAFGFFSLSLAATLAAVLGTDGLIIAVVQAYTASCSFTTDRSTREHRHPYERSGASSRDILDLGPAIEVRLVVAGVVIGSLVGMGLDPLHGATW